VYKRQYLNSLERLVELSIYSQYRSAHPGEDEQSDSAADASGLHVRGVDLGYNARAYEERDLRVLADAFDVYTHKVTLIGCGKD